MECDAALLADEPQNRINVHAPSPKAHPPLVPVQTADDVRGGDCLLLLAGMGNKDRAGAKGSP